MQSRYKIRKVQSLFLEQKMDELTRLSEKTAKNVSEIVESIESLKSDEPLLRLENTKLK